MKSEHVNNCTLELRETPLSLTTRSRFLRGLNTPNTSLIKKRRIEKRRLNHEYIYRLKAVTRLNDLMQSFRPS